jgi:hypothetical protein
VGKLLGVTSPIRMGPTHPLPFYVFTYGHHWTQPYKLTLTNLTSQAKVSHNESYQVLIIKAPFGTALALNFAPDSPMK